MTADDWNLRDVMASHRCDAITEDALWLINNGTPWVEVCARVGVPPYGLAKRLDRHNPGWRTLLASPPGC